MQRKWLAVLGIGIVVACTAPTSVCGCSPAIPPSALVFGTILGTDDKPLVGASATPRATLGACPGRGAQVVAGYGGSLADSSGRYRIYVSYTTQPDTVCIRMVARRTPLGVDSLVSTSVTLPLRLGLPYDSARVDFRFP